MLLILSNERCDVNDYPPAGAEGEGWMGPNTRGFSLKEMGLELHCDRCGGELPLLHPHIMVERNDAAGNVICEGCWETERKEPSAP